MSTSDSGMRDDGQVELNPAPGEPDHGPQPAPIPGRPADDAPREDWIEYAVALGADRAFVTSETTHWDDAERDHVVEPAFEGSGLIAFADRLAGRKGR